MGGYGFYVWGSYRRALAHRFESMLRPIAAQACHCCDPTRAANAVKAA